MTTSSGDPDSAPTWSNKGDSLWNTGHYEEALAAYEQALALDSMYVPAWVGKGSTLYDLNRYDEALPAFERALVLDPESVLAWIGKGATQSDLGRPQEALADFEQALTHDHTSAFSVYVLRNKTVALLQLQWYAEALAAADQALALDAASANDWQRKATALRGLGRIQEAAEAEARAKALSG